MRPRVIERLAECVGLPSPTPPGDVQLVAQWVEDWARELGAEVERQEVEPGKDNVLARLRFGPGPTLVFNTHMDVNDPSRQQWTSPPYVLTEREGRLYGRGSCDAKGSLVAILAMMERLAEAPSGLAGQLLLTAVMGEEAGGIGSLHLVSRGITADGAVVGEPTGLKVATAHKGTYIRRVRFQGTAAHSASPWRGHNAILDAAAFCLQCERVTEELAQRPHPLLGPATMTVTVMKGGDLQNTVPEEAVVTVDRRLVPGECHADCDQELQEVFRSLRSARAGLDVANVETVVATIPSETPRDTDIVSAALAAVGEAGRGQALPVGFPAGCDMSKLVGTARIPTVICGPGDLAQAHAPDEFVPAVEVVDAVTVYELIARRFLARGAQD